MPKKHITVTPATWTGAINKTTEIWHNFRLDSITVHFSSIPTTSEDLVVEVKSKDWTAYNTILYRINPSSSCAVDLLYIPNGQLSFEKWDEINVTYPNSNGNTLWVRIVTQSL